MSHDQELNTTCLKECVSDMCKYAKGDALQNVLTPLFHFWNSVCIFLTLFLA